MDSTRHVIERILNPLLLNQMASPCHQTHFESSCLELNGILSRGEQSPSVPTQSSGNDVADASLVTAPADHIGIARAGGGVAVSVHRNVMAQTEIVSKI